MKDFFQSPSDKLRLEIMLKSLSQGNLNLAILGDDEVALSYYARRIFEHLKAQEQVQVDLCLSADSEKLVQRFNQILSELTLDEALDKSQLAPIRRFLIFPDTQYIQDFDLQLLARLVNGLPASNIHVILLFNLREPYEKKLGVFGKHLIQWVLEKENSRASLTYDEEDELPSSRKEPKLGSAMSAKELKAQSGWGSEEDLPLSQAHSATERIEPVLSEAELLQAVHDVESELKRQEALDEVELAPKPKSSRLGWGLLLGLLVSMGALGALYRGAIMEEVQSMQDYLSTPQWDKTPRKDGAVTPHVSRNDKSVAMEMDGKAGNAPVVSAAGESVTAPKTEAESSGGASSSVRPGVKADDSLISDKEAILSPAKDLEATKPSGTKNSAKEPSKELTKAKSDPTFKEPPLKIPVLKDSTPEVVSTTPNKPVPVPMTAPATETAPMTKAAKPVAALEAASKPVLPPTLSPAPPPRSEANKEGSPDKPVGKNEWVNALSEKAWVLQLAAMPTKSEIIELKAKNPAFEGAQVLLTRNPQSNKPYFILVRGPFASKEEAQSVMQSNAALEKAWLRSAKSLKTQFQTH